jgi:hypothetical protein
MGILAPKLERVKHLRSHPPKWASVFCGRHNSPALAEESAHKMDILRMLNVLPHGARA